MKRLYAPWRDEYTNSNEATKKQDATPQECVFCLQIAEQNDEKNLIIKRYTYVFVVLNKYPYNAGHCLILPYAHVNRLAHLTDQQRHEYSDVISQCSALVEKMFNAEGVNIGINLGKASGAGIPAHLHTHVIPRWYGDTNFMVTTAETKVISIDMHKTYQKLKAGFDSY